MQSTKAQPPENPSDPTRKNRDEQGELLRLVFSLGFTVAAGIVVFFLAGVWVDRRFSPTGLGEGGVFAAIGAFGGVCVSFYWAYLRIARHLNDYPAPPRVKPPES